MAVLVAAVLLIQLGREMGSDEAGLAQDTPELPEGAMDAVVGKALSIRATAPVKVRVEIDGVETVRGTLCRELECRLDIEPAREIAVELADLSRASVIYNGSRVAPLGNLSAARRLVFVDDAD